MPAFGVSGAATATLLSRCIECSTLLIIILVIGREKEVFTRGYGSLSRRMKMEIMKKQFR